MVWVSTLLPSSCISQSWETIAVSFPWAREPRQASIVASAKRVDMPCPLGKAPAPPRRSRDPHHLLIVPNADPNPRSLRVDRAGIVLAIQEEVRVEGALNLRRTVNVSRIDH